MAYYKPVAASGSANGGTPWTDGIYSEIKSIVIRHGGAIDAIQVNYSIRGKDKDYLVSAPQHGANGGSADTIELEEGEYIAKVSGYIGTQTSVGVVVKSLKFCTSKGRTFGPYGTQTGTAFETPEGPNKIVGFYGRSGSYVDQLGFYLLHF